MRYAYIPRFVGVIKIKNFVILAYNKVFLKAISNLFKASKEYKKLWRMHAKQITSTTLVLHIYATNAAIKI